MVLRPIFRREKQLDYRLIMIEKDKCRIKLNKATHIGTGMLE